MEEVFARFPSANVSIRDEGPPVYVGRRIVVTGNPDGFRLLAEMLLTMADAVADPSRPQHIGWHFMVNSEVVPQLQLDQDYFLSLNCSPPVPD